MSTYSKTKSGSKIAKPLTPKTEPYFSPEPKSRNGKTMSHNKSMSFLGSTTINNGSTMYGTSTMSDMSLVKPHPMSQTLVERFEDMKCTYEYKKNLGTDVYDKTQHRKEIEKQVQALEKRV
eukprot:CAMPEP_0114593906 /NCGR_PEP_ID=MMETSP0125-20121206/15506_1 /TAXON_ID=485358 ORGANISM="Aristerostoma sp., Strain ATCC 50986" /NCGR_SAMPLE_ID=MMETSP0125 /ASSEMBLY_ACC=CAM_ASM_000245 /LENGTH=120 /DNA_ID=CAMNT_0001793565 /DNA_START=224 /DNA_END=586 /DNA_ORIENTATION=-